MSTVVSNEVPRILIDVRPATPMTVSDLVIHEFDQWSNPKDSMLNGTTCLTYSKQAAFVEAAVL
jgi:hypothetical protein